MSITKDFEKRLLPLENWTVYGKDETEALLAHARSLEQMLKSYMYAPGVWSNCSYCGKEEGEGHLPTCKLAKLLEDVE